MSSLEVKTIAKQAHDDVLFEQAKKTDKKRPAETELAKKRSKKRKGAKDTAEAADTLEVPHLTFKTLVTGALVLGQVATVTKLKVGVSVGGNLVGYVPITSVSDEVTTMLEKYEDEGSEEEEDDEDKPTMALTPEFPLLPALVQVGQWVRAVVVPSEDDRKKQLTLTLEPTHTNADTTTEGLVGNVVQGSVKSIEDHGVLVNLGAHLPPGFVSKKAAGNLAAYKVGLVHLFVADKLGRAVALRPVDPEQTVTRVLTIDALHPGALVEAKVSDVLENGVHARLLNVADAFVEMVHSGAFTAETLAKKYPTNSTFKARIIAVLPSDGAKRFLLSAQDRVVALGPVSTEPLAAFPTGYIFEDQVEIAGLDDTHIFLALPGSITAQVHRLNVEEDKFAGIDYPVGSKHRARVVGFNAFDNVLLASLNPKVIDSKFAIAEDIPVGEYVPAAEVTRILPEGKGLVLKIFGEFEATVAPEHMSDIKLVYPERKFKVGAKVKARVLLKLGRKLYATVRKSLVNMDDDTIVSSYDNVDVGFRTTGLVAKFVAGGAVVTFFGNTKAYLLRNEVSEVFVENINEFLKEGQAVSVRVLTVSPADQRMTVTLRQAAELSSKQALHLEQIVVGRTLASAVIVEKVKEAVLVELDGSNLRGVLHSGHISDGNYEQCRIAYKAMQIGDKLEVLVLEKDIRSRAVVVTAKKSLINAAKTELLPMHYEDIHVGSVVSGFIKSVTNLGLFVQFSGRLTGLVLPKNASDDPTEDLLKRFQKHQSVSCNVIRVDDENKRFLLSLTELGNAFKTRKLRNPIDTAKILVTDYACGEVVAGIVESVEPTHLHIRLADNYFGRVHPSQCERKQPLASFKKGDKVKAKVLGYHNTKTGSFSVTPKFTEDVVADLSLLKAEIKSKELYTPTPLEDVQVGSSQTGYIMSFEHGLAKVEITPGLFGDVAGYSLSDDIEKLSNIPKNFPAGTALKLTVVRHSFKFHRLVLTAKASELVAVTDLKVGQQVAAKVFKVSESNVLVEMGHDVIGRSFVTDALEDFEQDVHTVFTAGQIVIATVLEIDTSIGKAVVLLRDESKAKDRRIDSIHDIKRGDVVKGFIKAISNAGLFISLNRDLYALVRPADISDVPLDDWRKFFKPYQCVTGRILLCEQEGRVLMTMKDSEVNGELESFKSFGDLEVDDIMDGTIKRIVDFGVFVRLSGTADISGLCHRSEISDNRIENIGDYFSEGDRVKVKILKIDAKSKKLSLGMKASYFTDLQDEDVVMEDAESEDEVMDDALDESDLDSDNETTTQTQPSQKASGLSTNGFDWTASILDQAENNESLDDEEDFMQVKKKRKGKKEVHDRTEELNKSAPESVGDFERLLIGNPDSSVLWMNYMSFQLQLGEIDKSREIAERALKTINYREEQEKMNIWIAILNLENSFGTSESLAEAFARATQYMDSLTMHQKLIGIYILSENLDKAEELYKVMTKKFAQNVSVWVLCASFYMDRQMSDEAHQVLARALQSLPKRDHIEVVRKFAQLEFSKGDPEQGRSLFEGLVSDAPKRTDLWNVYIDQEIKSGNRDHVVGLFERVITKKLSRKQAKFFFSKWLSYEEESGSEQSVARVKALAVDYVQKLSAPEEEE